MSRQLSVKQIDDLQKTIDSIVKDNIESIAADIVSNLVEKGAEKATELNDAAPQSSAVKSEVIAFSGKSKKGLSGLKGYIALKGPSAVYDEFGTGEEGADDGHPLKGAFKLNAYNSGPFVSTHISKTTGRHYWFYSPAKGQEYFDSETGYTEGAPSGKQMYNTSIYLRKIKQQVIKETVDKWLAKAKSELE